MSYLSSCISRTALYGAIFAAHLVPSSAFADNYMGADAVIGRVIKAEGSPGTPVEGDRQLAKKQLDEDARRYIQEWSALTPEVAGERWLDLLLRYLDLAGSGMGMSMGSRDMTEDSVDLGKLLKYIPGPESWPVMEARLDDGITTDSRKVAVTRVLLARLQEDVTAANRAFEKLTEIEKEKSTSVLQYFTYPDIWKNEIPVQPQQPVPVDERFRRILELRKLNSNDGSSITVPDLLSVTDRTSATKLIETALQLPDTLINAPAATDTKALFNEIAVKHVESMEEPRWELSHSLDSMELYEAMREKFTADEEEATTPTESVAAGAFASILGLSRSNVSSNDSSDQSRRKAEAFYFYDLLRADRVDQAEQLLTSDPVLLEELYGIWHIVADKVPVNTVWDLVTKLVRSNSYTIGDGSAGKSMYRLLEQVARQRGALNEYQEFLAEALQNGELPEETQYYVTNSLAEVLLELDRPDQAIENFTKVAAVDAESDLDTESRAELHLPAATKIVEVGRLLDRPEWIDLGIKLYREQMTSLGKVGFGDDAMMAGWYVDNNSSKVIDEVVKAGRGVQAEELITAELVRRAKLKAEGVSRSYESPGNLLDALITIYGKTDRHDDVLSLLTNGLWWPDGVKDVADLTGIRGSSNQLSGSSVVAVARALESHGRKDAAVTLLKGYLQNHPSTDRAYDQLTTMTGTEIIPWLDELYARDRFEERPLMWKAIVLEKSGDLKQAEEVARQVLKIDPTDGEQAPGERIRSYEVLANILEKSGQVDEAQTLQRIVKAVRIAEKGDAFNAAGLVSQAIEKYREASLMFNDAYCVEWRLARRLQERGDDAGAEEHYRKAFTMMPQQFGRMANLCFGCERVFAGEKPQSIANKILMEMASEPDAPATVYYLLGTLREEQNLVTEAADFYTKAIETDPEYFDALKKLYEIREQAFLSPAHQREVAEKLVELDPSMEHFYLDGDSALSPAALWTAAVRSAKPPVDQDVNIWPLTANVARVNRERMKDDQNMATIRQKLYDYMEDERAPGRLIMQQYWMNEMKNLLQAVGRR